MKPGTKSRPVRRRSNRKARAGSIEAALKRKKKVTFKKSECPPGWTEELEREFRASGPQVYDKAKWHYGGDFPKGLPKKQAFVHTGMFAGWLMDHDMISEEFLPEAKRFKRREITGPEAYVIWDGGLDSEMLTARGNQFAQDYYEKQFFKDYEKLMARGLPSSYHVEDTWTNYEILKRQIDARYADWRKRRKTNKHPGQKRR